MQPRPELLKAAWANRVSCPVDCAVMAVTETGIDLAGTRRRGLLVPAQRFTTKLKLKCS